MCRRVLPQRPVFQASHAVRRFHDQEVHGPFRHLRWRQFQEAERTGAWAGQNINRCRLCGQYVRGHVCSGGVVQGANTESCVDVKDPDE